MNSIYTWAGSMEFFIQYTRLGLIHCPRPFWQTSLAQHVEVLISDIVSFLTPLRRLLVIH